MSFWEDLNRSFIKSHGMVWDEDRYDKMIEDVARRVFADVIKVNTQKGSNRHPYYNHALLNRKRKSQTREPFTYTEFAIISLASLGYKGPETAKYLSMSYDTYKTHVRHIKVRLEGLGVNSSNNGGIMPSAVAYCIRKGLID